MSLGWGGGVWWLGCPARAWLMIMKITWRITNIITKMIWWTDVCQLPPADSLMQSAQALVIQHYLWRLLFVSDAHWGRKFSPFAKIMCGESRAFWRLQGMQREPVQPDDGSISARLLLRGSLWRICSSHPLLCEMGVFHSTWTFCKCAAASGTRTQEYQNTNKTRLSSLELF